jgi:hypothetical protein
MLPEVCECLNIRGLEKDAFSVLNTFGNEAVSELERFFLASSGNINTSRTILRLLGNIRTNESRIFLFSRLWSNSRLLKESALKYLIELDFKPGDEEKDKLHQLISETIGIITWNLSALKCLEKSNDSILLNVLNKEIVRWKSYLFDLLSITYDRSSVVKIKDNLESGTVESVNYALEMIDIVIDEAVKQKVIMLLDAVPDEEKLKNLYQFYPVEIPEYNRLIEDVINRDYNLVSIWTKACFLRNIKEIEGETITESVVALLFSPEEILQEESARIISQSSMELFRSISHRIPESSQKRLIRIAQGEVPSEEFHMARNMFLSNCFPSIPEDELMSVSAQLKYHNDFTSLASGVTGGTLIWPVSMTRQTGRAHVYYSGKLNMTDLNAGLSGNIYYYTLSLSVAEDFNFQYPGSSLEIFKYIETNEV